MPAIECPLLSGAQGRPPTPNEFGAPALQGVVDFFEPQNYNHTSNFEVFSMAQIFAKVSEIREKAAAALEDVPDTLIGTVVSLTILTVVGLGILMVFGYMLTR